MIYVCDAVMGTGKSTAAINYMNEHSDRPFIYITPRLTETDRIQDACPELRFCKPNNFDKEYNHSKIEHTALLIKKKRNIASTHQAFRGYTPEMLNDIRENGYTLIMDESVDVLESASITPYDWDMLRQSGLIVPGSKPNTYTLDESREYHGVFSRTLKTLQAQELIVANDKVNGSVFFWTISEELLSAFKDVFILTYLFEGQSIHHFLEMYSLPYERIGVHRDGGTFRFGEYPGYVPEYTHNLSDKIYILDYEKMNRIGENKGDLSKTWFERNPELIEQLRKNVANYFTNIHRGDPSGCRMWSTFNQYESSLAGSGYASRFVSFNTKATNDYRDRTCLAYLINIYMPVGNKTFYQSNGVKVDDDIYALSIMSQWIWRSAIRDGKPIDLYLPSSRMREILNNWIKQLSE